MKSRYFKNYFKHNGIVLVCELLIVLLLSLVCAILLDASPKWLAPVLAVAAYMLAELRFMMAYVAKCVKRDHMLAKQAREAQDDRIEREVVVTRQAAPEMPTTPIQITSSADEQEDDEDEDEDEDDFDEEESNEIFIEESEDDDISDFAGEEEETDDEQPNQEYEAEEDEVSEVTDEDDEDIDTFEED